MMTDSLTVTHVAWDEGAIADAFADVFGAGIRDVLAQKSTKTMCGKRVAMSRISNQHATCPDCAAELKRQADGCMVLREIEQSIDAGNGIPEKYLNHEEN